MDFELSHQNAKDALITTFEGDLMPKLVQEASRTTNAYLASLAKLYVVDSTRGNSFSILIMEIKQYLNCFVNIS